MSEISQLLQDYPTGNSIVEIRIMDMQGYILGTTNQTQQSVVGTRSTEADVQQVVVSNTVQSYNFTEGETRYWKYVSPIDPVNTASGNPVGIISVTSNIESRYTQVKDIRGYLYQFFYLCYYFGHRDYRDDFCKGITRPIAEMKRQTEQIV